MIESYCIVHEVNVEVLDIFKDLDIDDRYASLGSVVIRENGFYYEITTFRNEEYVFPERNRYFKLCGNE